MRIILIIAIIPLILSCAAQPSIRSDIDEEGILKERVKLYWEAKRRYDWEAVKNLVDPDIRKDLIPYFESLKMKTPQAELISYTIKKIEIKGENSAMLSSIVLKWKHPLLESLPVKEIEVKDKWIKKGGIWYIIIAKPDLSEILKDKAGGKEVE